MTDVGTFEILEAIESINTAVVVSHIRQDGDAVGSKLAMASFLEKMGVKVDVFASDPAPRSMEWLIQGRDYILYDESIDHRQRIANADAVFIVDTNAGQRLGRLEKPVMQNLNKRILIDHHLNPEKWFDMAWVIPSASSTGEMVYDLIAEKDPNLIDREIAEALYVAIMTDTGSFRFNSVTPKVHHAIGDLMDRGALNAEDIHMAVFKTRSAASLRLLSMVLNSLKTTHGGKVAYMVMSRSMLQQTGVGSDEAEGFVDYGLTIEGAHASLIFLEMKGAVKMSFRSQGDLAVNGWARQFNGGGHKNASGAFVHGNLDDVMHEVLAAGAKYV